MTEQILAYGGQNSYAQSEGRIIMPGSEPGEGLRPSVGHKQNTRHEVLPKQTQAPNNAESLRDPNTFLGRINGLLDLATAGKQPVEVPFGDVWDFSRVINSLRDTSKVSKVQVYDREISDMKGLLGKVGLDAELIDGMQDNEVIAATQLALPRVQVAQAQDSDFRHILEKDRPAVRALAIQEVERARDTGENEQIFSPEEVGERVVIGELEKKKVAGGAPVKIEDLDPAAVVAEAQNYVREIQRAIDRKNATTRFKDFQAIERSMTQASLDGKLDASNPDIEMIRNLLTKRIDELAGDTPEGTLPAEDLLTITAETKKQLLIVADKDVTNPEWKAAKVKLQQMINNSRVAVGNLAGKKIEDLAEDDLIVLDDKGDKVNVYKYVFEVTKAIDDFNKFAKDKDKRLKIIQAFDDGTGDGVENLELFIDASKHKETNLLRTVDRYYSKLYDDFSQEEQYTMVGDINERANYYINAILGGWRDLDVATREILTMVGRKSDEFGIRQWRATRYFQRLADAVRVSQLTQRPADWADVSKNLSSLYSYIEAAGVGSEDIGPMIQRANGLIETMPAEKEEDRKRRLTLNRQLEAFKAWHLLIITADAKDMDPEALIRVYADYFEGREERTLEDFVNRFSEDNKGREFYIARTNEKGELMFGPEGELSYEKVNLFDIQHELYSDRLRDERVMMNMIEEMTSYSIENPFDRQTIRRIQQRVGFDRLNSDWQRKWEGKLEELRQYFVKKMDGKIAENTATGGKWAGRTLHVDDVWGVRNGIEDPKEFIAVTFDLVKDWHMKRTLHGAFGGVTREDSGELSIEIGKELAEARVDEKKFKDVVDELTDIKYLTGKSYLEIRREIMQLKLRSILDTRKLNVNRNGKSDKLDLREGDIDELQEVGFLASVDYNAYQWAWFNQWSNYDSIRVYSRGSRDNYKLHDDFELVTFHQSTNLFNARHIDHGWEFFHENNENRGRAKENDVNRIWKQNLPGKHHYIFPQNTLMVRFAENFMDDKQKEYVQVRVAQLMQEYAFDNVKYHDEFVGWMKNVVIMDMIENGEISLGQKKFSEVIKNKKLSKFAGIDVMSDRMKDKKFMGVDVFQDYLSDPSEDKFVMIIDRLKGFYSTRVARSFAFAALGVRSHWDIAGRHSERLFHKPNLSSGSMENFTNGLVNQGYLEKQTSLEFKRRYLGFFPFIDKNLSPSSRAALELLGTVPVRRLRQTLEAGRRLAWESKYSPISILLAMIGEFLKRLPGQAAGNSR